MTLGWTSYTLRQWWLAAQATGALLVARVALAVLPFPLLARLVGASESGLEADGSAEVADPRVRQIGWAVQAAARRVPWLSTCLVQALASALLLRSRGIGYRVWLGVNKSEGDLQAHAWVSCGERLVVGGAGSNAFTPIAVFARAPRQGSRRPA